MYVVGLSGPPRSGKDSIGAALHHLLNTHGVRVQRLALSLPMRLAVYALLGIEYDTEHYEANKDKPQELFGGKTIREVMISMSETWAKPAYGQNFWAQSAINHIEPDIDVLIVTDMGFTPEVITIEGVAGPENCVWAWLFREGTDWSLDSRNYVGNPHYQTQLYNDATVEETARRLYGRLVNQFGWKL